MSPQNGSRCHLKINHSSPFDYNGWGVGGGRVYVLNCLEYPPPSPSFMDIGQPLFYSTFLVQEQSFVHLAVLFHNAAKFFIKWSLSKDLVHRLRTPRERFFLNTKLLGLGRQIGPNILGAFGVSIFFRTISTHFGTVSPFSMFSIISTKN